MIPLEIFTNKEAREAFYENNKDKLALFNWVRDMREAEQYASTIILEDLE